jgi:hypothetical protein
MQLFEEESKAQLFIGFVLALEWLEIRIKFDLSKDPSLLLDIG